MILSESVWRAKAAAHETRVREELADVIYRRDRGLKHPVDDFMFQYYNLRPRQLLAWHPGLGVALEGATEFADRPHYIVTDGLAQVDETEFRARRSQTIASAQELLQATATKPAQFGCFGMHEWAMVYKLAPNETRHPYLPLRLPPEQIAAVTNEVGCRCSHFDAFRFFTEAAKPLNVIQPTRQQQPVNDQPGCLHVNMDLYKWAGKLLPAVSSELLFECFRLARRIRVVDMRASAYDLSEWGLGPIKVETAAGRADYVRRQREFSVAAAGLRKQLLLIIDRLVASQ